MPTKAVHLEIAEKNETFARSLDLKDEVQRGWSATVLFYSALHMIEAYFGNQRPPLHSIDHRTRDSNIGKDAVTKLVYDEYQELKNLSQAARYFGQYPSAAEYRDDVEGNFSIVKAEVSSRC